MNKNECLRQALLGSFGKFIWLFCELWFVETEHGNFIWSDPDYPNGDNTFTRVDGSYAEYCHIMNIDLGRDKGSHNIEHYCGDTFTLTDTVIAVC